MAEHSSTRRAVLITGASSGIGQACALRLDRLGIRVFATVLPGETGEVLRQKGSERLTILPLDVTDPATIAAASTTVSEAVGAEGLAGLVNNAGIGGGRASGPLEFVPLERLRRQFEVNVIGQIAVTQAFLPLLRQGRGRIVMMSSMTRRLTCPFNSPYGASKAALEALAAALRVEVAPWRIPVVILECGIIATPIWDQARRELDETIRGLPPVAQQLYARAMDATRAFLGQPVRSATPPDRIAAVVTHALTARRPKTRYVVGHSARALGLVMSLAMRDETRDRLVTRAMRLPEKSTRPAAQELRK